MAQDQMDVAAQVCVVQEAGTSRAADSDGASSLSQGMRPDFVKELFVVLTNFNTLKPDPMVTFPWEPRYLGIDLHTCSNAERLRIRFAFVTNKANFNDEALAAMTQLILDQRLKLNEHAVPADDDLRKLASKCAELWVNLEVRIHC